MGQKHRQERAKVKKEFRQRGFVENEFGELVHKTTKAEARRLVLRRLHRTLDEMVKSALKQFEAEEPVFREMAKLDLMDHMARRASADVHAQIEAELFA